MLEERVAEYLDAVEARFILPSWGTNYDEWDFPRRRNWQDLIRAGHDSRGEYLVPLPRNMVTVKETNCDPD